MWCGVWCVVCGVCVSKSKRGCQVIDVVVPLLACYLNVLMIVVCALIQLTIHPSHLCLPVCPPAHAHRHC